ncbi:hypothetical protein DL546_008150 [Coniochaeta pulveracea]|uniref:Uncharacterized protein n=1 Tax=Coniochaeta pulveracea TaxID=177199 RepID=A0A420YC42_9PEZI|nr:hypothetical protein DL546_008150 [Coniochaeta pulveracea]
MTVISLRRPHHHDPPTTQSPRQHRAVSLHQQPQSQQPASPRCATSQPSSVSHSQYRDTLPDPAHRAYPHNTMPSADAEATEGSSGTEQNLQRPRIPHARRSNSANFSRRPSSIQQQSHRSDDEDDRPLVIKKSLKPPLLRSQSEYASPHRSPDEDINHEEQETYWGARHGFEDHYQSEDIISQLANVSSSLGLAVGL